MTKTPGNTALDPQPLIDMFGDDATTIREILGSFITPSQRTLAEIETGLSQQSAEQVQMAAHKLKSSARSIGALDLGETSARLEAAARAEDWPQIETLASSLRSSLEDVISAINAY